MTINELAEIIIRQIHGPALGGTWTTTAEHFAKATGCGDFELLEDTLVAMIHAGLIRVFKWQAMPNGQIIQTYIPETEIEAEIFDEHGFSIEPLPAAEEAFERLNAMAGMKA
jgi:hypothetical protein